MYCLWIIKQSAHGIYAPAQIVTDARNHSVEIRPVDVNHSFWNNVLEEKVNSYHALRLGFRQIHDMRSEEAQRLVEARKEAFTNINQLLDARVSISSLEHWQMRMRCVH